MEFGSLVSVAQRHSAIAGLALAAFGLPLLLFELSFRSWSRSRKPRLWLSAETWSSFVRVRWAAVAVRGRDIEGYRVVRQSDSDNRRVIWTIAEPDQTALDDWGIVAGERYRFTVEMYLENGRGDRNVVAGAVAVAVPTVTQTGNAGAGQ